MAYVLTFVFFAPTVILLCILLRKIYDKTIGLLRGSFANPLYKGILGLAGWSVMWGSVFWIAHRDFNISDEACIVLLSVWFLMLVAGVVLTQVLPDGRFKRIFNWIFFAVAFIPPLWLCVRILGKGGRGNTHIWRHISRGIRGAGAAGAAAASKKESRGNRRSKK